MLRMISELRLLWSYGGFRRKWKFIFQYLWRGWSDADTWSVDSYVVRMSQPVMHRYMELVDGFIVIDEDLQKIHDDAINAIDTLEDDWDLEKLQRDYFDKLTWFWW